MPARAVLNAVAFARTIMSPMPAAEPSATKLPLVAVGARRVGIAEEMNRRIVGGADAVDGRVGHDVQRRADQRHAERDVEGRVAP